MRSQYSGMYPVVDVQLMHPNATEPRFARDGDAGCDLCTMDAVTIEPHKTVLVRSGIALAIPRGFEGELRPRSGMASKRGITLANTPSTIDSNYRGEVLLPLHNMTDEPVEVEAGTRVCQLLINQRPEPIFRLVDELDDTDRGSAGFGSSGYGRL